jgi:hypothetical protein
MHADHTILHPRNDPDPDSPAIEETQSNRPLIAACAAVLLVTAGLLVYSRTLAFAWDEGYHLVAAWLIAHGKTPYIDFVFPQTPLNAYWNALLLRLFGEDWRVPHTAGALLTSWAVAMVAAYVYRSLPASKSWRGAAAVAAAVIMGCNTAVVDFDSLQAYGMCLFMIVSAYLATVSGVNRTGLLRPALAGLCAGAAAASSLLTAPVAPVLVVWMFLVNRAGSRIGKLAAFCAGFVVAFIPLLRLLIRAPHPVIFGFLHYQLLYRKVEWEGAGVHNLGEVLSWANSSQAVLLVLLAAAAIAFADCGNSWSAGGSGSWRTSPKSELYLCGWMAIAITIHLLTARPTFTRYFLLTVPFLSILATNGLYQVTERLASRPRPWLAAGILCIITFYGLGASLFDERDDLMWKDVEQVAAKVREVTPPTAALLADETVYFLLRRTPPSGMELEDSHKLRFPDAEAAALHIVPRPKLDVMIRAGRFDTVEMCDDDEIGRIGLPTLYGKSATVGTCQVFWSFGTKAEAEAEK